MTIKTRETQTFNRESFIKDLGTYAFYLIPCQWGVCLCVCVCVYTYICCYLVAWLRLALCDPMDCSTLGRPVHHQLPEFAQTHVHCQ